MKKIFIPIFISLLIWGCTGSINTANMTPDEYFKYAKSLFDDEDYLQSIQEFQSILLQYPGNAIADDAQYYLAESHFMKGEYILAAYEYSRLIKDMPASEFVSQAQLMLAQSYFELSPRYQLDQRYTKKAIEEFQAFIDFFPTNIKVPEAEQKIKELNDKLAEKEFNNAVIYEKMEYWKAAIYYYNIVTETYHDSKYCPVAMYNKIKLYINTKENKNALKEISLFLQKFPADSKNEEIKKLQETLTNNLSINAISG
jgi:outer membrane protein assembly factor BamD